MEEVTNILADIKDPSKNINLDEFDYGSDEELKQLAKQAEIAKQMHDNKFKQKKHAQKSDHSNVLNLTPETKKSSDNSSKSKKNQDPNIFSTEQRKTAVDTSGTKILIKLITKQFRAITLVSINEWKNMEAKLKTLKPEEQIYFSGEYNMGMTIKQILSSVKIETDPTLIKYFLHFSDGGSWIGVNIITWLKDSLESISDV